MWVSILFLMVLKAQNTCYQRDNCTSVEYSAVCSVCCVEVVVNKSKADSCVKTQGARSVVEFYV